MIGARGIFGEKQMNPKPLKYKDCCDRGDVDMNEFP